MTRQRRFGEWYFNPDTDEVTDGSKRVTLEPRVARLLTCFLDHPGELLSHDRLVDTVWDGRVVSNEAVRRCVSSLRQALATDGEASYIRTIHKKGYIANFPRPVTAADLPGVDTSPVPAREPSATAEPATRTAAVRGRQIVRPLGIAVVAMLGIAAALWLYRGELQQRTDAADAMAPRTIAVLPFVNLSEDSGSSYFSDGLAAELIGLLGRFSAFRVTAQTSSFQFKEQTRDVREIGEQLGVRYLVEGHVRRQGDQVRIGAKLIDTETGFQVWTQTYDRELADLFDVQQDIAQEVARALQVVLVQKDGSSMLGRAPASAEAHLEYLKGRELMTSQATDDLDAASRHFQRAIALDPAYAAAYAQLAETMLLKAAATPELAAAKKAAAPLIEKAITLDPELGEAWVTRAWLHDDPEYKEADLRKGLALNPSYAPGYNKLAELLSLAKDGDRTGEALALIDRARAIDPLLPRSHHLKAIMLESRGEYDEVVALEKQALQADPRFRSALVKLSRVSAVRGDYVEAVDYGERALSIDSRAEWVRKSLISTYLQLGNVEAARHLNVPPTRWGTLHIHFFTGNWRKAGEYIYATYPHEGAAVGSLDAAHALLGHALETGEYERALDFVEKHFGFDGTLPDDLNGRALGLYVWLASLRYVAGGDAESKELIETLQRRLVDRKAQLPGIAGFNEYGLALAAAVLGERDAALAALERQLDSDLHAWWWWFRDYPAFEELRDEPRFQAVFDAREAHAKAQRERLMEMRHDGDIPERTSSSDISSG